MPDSKLRLTRKTREIRAALKSVTPASELLLWFLDDDKRVLFKGSLIRIDESEEKISFRIDEIPPGLIGHDFVFVKFNKSSGVGKCAFVSLVDHELTLKISDELIVEEKRRYRRIHFRIEDEKKVTLSIGDASLSLVVANASRSGVKLRADASALKILRAGLPIQATQLGNEKISIACDFVRNDESTVALHFSSDLPQALFDAFISTPLTRKVNAEKFFNDQEYLDTVRSNMESTIEKLEKRPKFATAMKTLKVDRDGNYIKIHIDLLCYVSCSLGRMLGWVTKKTLDKLIVAAYLHDIRYFENPRLARIQGLGEFQKMKGQMTLAEQKIFMEGPEYSSLISKEDGNDSTDIERILIQQKERPDGSGFPAGVDFKQLFPLSCLFMVSHSFVDYIYNNPNWSFKEFTSQARAVYKGPYFIKILEAFDELS